MAKKGYPLKIGTAMEKRSTTQMKLWRACKAVCNGGDSAMLRELLEAGTNPNELFTPKVTFFLQSIIDDVFDAFALFLKHGAYDKKALHWAVSENRDSLWIEMLLEKGADPNYSPKNQATCLEHAIKYKNRKNIFLLIRAGAKIDEDQEECPLVTIALLECEIEKLKSEHELEMKKYRRDVLEEIYAPGGVGFYAAWGSFNLCARKDGIDEILRQLG